MEGIILCAVLYIFIIAMMCWSQAQEIKRPPDDKIKKFIDKSIKRYK